MSPIIARAARNVTFHQACLEQGIDLGDGEPIDPEDIPSEWGYGIEVPPEEQEIASSSGWPGAVPIRPANWNEELCTYKLAYGDTLSGLAATYLGSPQRWTEIWAEQDDTFRASRDPDELVAGEWIHMPAEALAVMQEARERGTGGGVIVTGGGAEKPVPKNGNGKAGLSTGAKVAIGAGACAALAALYFATR